MSSARVLYVCTFGSIECCTILEAIAPIAGPCGSESRAGASSGPGRGQRVGILPCAKASQSAGAATRCRHGTCQNGGREKASAGIPDGSCLDKSRR